MLINLVDLVDKKATSFPFQQILSVKNENVSKRPHYIICEKLCMHLFFKGKEHGLRWVAFCNPLFFSISVYGTTFILKSLLSALRSYMLLGIGM